MKLRRNIAKGILYAIMLAVLLVWMFPFYWIIRTSLMDVRQILRYPPVWIPNPVTFKNYTQGLRALPFDRFYVNTLVIVLLCMTGAMFTSTLAAYSFSRLRWPGRDKLFSLILSAMMLPSAVTLVPTFIGWSAVGYVNTIAPLTVPSWFGGGAFFIFLLRQFYRTIPREYDEAAVVDGAGYFQIYWRILLPMIKPALITVALFSFINNWNDFMHPLVYLSDEKKYTISLGLRSFMGMYNTDYGYMMAATVISVVPVIVIILFGQRYIVEGVVMTGIKG